MNNTNFVDNKKLSRKINNSNVKEMGKVPSERIRVADFNPDWAYSHHAYISYFKEKWYIAWSSGKINEDDLGQRILYAVSNDFLNWSKPQVLMDSTQGYYSETVLSCYGFYQNNGRLYVYITMQEFLPQSLRENGKLRPKGEDSKDILYRRRYMKSTLDGKEWSEAVYISSGGGTQCVTNGLALRKFFFDMTNCFYNDDGNAAVWITSGLSKKQIDLAHKNGADFMCEAAGYLTDDKIIHMLNRSNSGRLWHSASLDNGVTWTDSYPTKFLTESSQFNVGRLPDGKYYIICNSERYPCFDRIPLYLYISNDGYHFDRRYVIRDEEDYELHKKGMYKGGCFAYPTTVVRDGYIHISYTLQKEAVEVTRISLLDIL